MTRIICIALALLVGCAGCGYVESQEGAGSAQQKTDRAQYRELQEHHGRLNRLETKMEGMIQFAEAVSGNPPGAGSASGPVTLAGPLPPQQQSEEDDQQRRINLAIARIKARQGVCPTEPGTSSGPTMVVPSGSEHLHDKVRVLEEETQALRAWQRRVRDAVKE